MGLGYGFWALKMKRAHWAKNYLIENFFFFFSFSKRKTRTDKTNGPKAQYYTNKPKMNKQYKYGIYIQLVSINSKYIQLVSINSKYIQLVSIQ